MAGVTSAISTYKTYLCEVTGESTYKRLIDITSCSALGGAPEGLDITTCSDPMRKYLAGIIELSPIELKAIYNQTDFKKLSDRMETEKSTPGKYAIVLCGTDNGSGEITVTNSAGYFTFEGQITVWLDDFEVNAPHTISISIAPTTEVKFNEAN